MQKQKPKEKSTLDRIYDHLTIIKNGSVAKGRLYGIEQAKGSLLEKSGELFAELKDSEAKEWRSKALYLDSLIKLHAQTVEGVISEDISRSWPKILAYIELTLKIFEEGDNIELIRKEIEETLGFKIPKKNKEET